METRQSCSIVSSFVRYIFRWMIEDFTYEKSVCNITSLYLLISFHQIFDCVDRKLHFCTVRLRIRVFLFLFYRAIDIKTRHVREKERKLHSATHCCFAWFHEVAGSAKSSARNCVWNCQEFRKLCSRWLRPQAIPFYEAGSCKNYCRTLWQASR